MALLSFLRRMLNAPAEAAPVEPAANVNARTAFPVVLAAIDGDDGNIAASAVAAALDGTEGLILHRVSMGIGTADDSETPAASLGKVVARARTLAATHQASAVIGGQMLTPGMVRLRFIAASIDSDPASGTWTVGDMLDVPVPLPAGGAGFLRACVLASVTLANDMERRTRLTLLRSVLSDGEALIHGENAALSGVSKAIAMVAYGGMLTEMGIRTHQQPVLDRAHQVLRGVVSKATRPTNETIVPPVVIAAARLHLAAIAADGGGRDGDMVRLEESGRQFQTAAQAITGDVLPDDNASLWVQFGRAMHRLSALSGKTEHMKAAVQGYHLASQVWSKGSNPDRWADLHYGMGSVLSQYGEFTGSAPALERAVVVFEKVAEVWTRETNARRWAGLQNNIGACRFALGKRSGALPALREAAERFSRALEVYQALNMTRNVHVTQKNIARVERLISVQEEAG